MSSVNAPVPDATGPAEVFDSTIAPSTQPSISAIGGPGPNNLEGPQHTGAFNVIDTYFFNQYIINTTVTWSTGQDAGTILWSLPIHPSTIHPWLAHLAKMYNTWIGGFDVGAKVAGTGFHAGAVMFVRTPPNIKPAKLLTPTAASAFEYKIIDPKTLQVELQSAIDQRNIMYHYLPLDLNEKSSFGGYLSLMVAIPLNTSSSGANQIAIQIYTKPSQNFMFSQIRPIDYEVVNVSDPEDLLNSINFHRGSRHALTKQTTIDTISIWTKKTKPYVEVETTNAVKFNKDPMNGFFVKPFDILQILKQKEIVSKLVTVAQFGESKYSTLGFPAGTSIIAWSNQNIDEVEIPPFTGKGMLYLAFLNKQKNKIATVSLPGLFSPVVASDPDPINIRKQKFVVDYHTAADDYFVFQFENDNYKSVSPATEIFPEFNEFLEDVGFSIDTVKFDFTYVPYAPPITESIITFTAGPDNYVQTLELRDELAYGSYGGFMDPKDALIFELVDNKVDLPILPVKLHYSGFFTTIEHLEDRKLALHEGRYSFKYIGRSSAADPLSAGAGKVKSLSSYARNMMVSRMFSSPPGSHNSNGAFF